MSAALHNLQSLDPSFLLETSSITGFDSLPKDHSDISGVFDMSLDITEADLLDISPAYLPSSAPVFSPSASTINYPSAPSTPAAMDHHHNPLAYNYTHIQQSVSSSDGSPFDVPGTGPFAMPLEPKHPQHHQSFYSDNTSEHSPLPESLSPSISMHSNTPLSIMTSQGPSPAGLLTTAVQDGPLSAVSTASSSSTRNRKTKFTEEEDKLLIRLKWQERMSWREIAKYFPGRTHGALQVRYCTKLKSRTIDWGRRDIEQLHKVVSEYERDKWHAVCQRMENKYSPEQCRNKFLETVSQLPASESSNNTASSVKMEKSA